MRVLVCGGRNYSDRDHVFRTLTTYHSKEPISLIIEGGAFGADRLAREWAKANVVDCQTFDAKWNDFTEPCIIKYGKFGKYNVLAGTKRNKKMLGEGQPDVVFAFPGGSGTADMVALAKKAGVSVTRFSPRGEMVDARDLKSLG